MDKQIQDLIHSIFGALPEELIGGIQRLLDGRDRELANDEDLWTEKDVVLITYADQICSSNASPLQTQQEFLLDHRLNKLISCVHLLPFCPYTSDDGFSVVDYLAVDQASGSWSDIEQLGQSFDLMFDLVLNHASQKSEWFQRFLAGDPEYNEFFIEMDSKADLSKVVRPRSLPLLTEFSSDAGSKHVWTTFSADQVDLNYANPRVMMRMLEILVEYARRGARVIRLDAIAFLWKELGTTCLHLPQTHAAVKLMRRVVDLVVPGTLLLTETNVPHAENLSYFGDGSDEAHMVYQFSLPPLIMDAVHSHDTSILKNWLSELQPPNVKTTFFNFTASHDGIGVRPLEGIVPEHRIQELVEIVRQRGGMVNTRQVSGVGDRPYELNLTYLSAVTGDDSEGVTRRVKRFLATQALMLSMQGIPAVYFHSLVGSPNDYEGVRTSGQNRRINRHKYDRGELDLALSDFNGVQRRVFDGYCRLLEVRKRQPACHPSASQEVIDLPTNGLIGLRRVAKGGETLVSLVNLSGQATAIGCDLIGRGTYFDEISEERIYSQQSIEMSPYQVRWLTAE